MLQKDKLGTTYREFSRQRYNKYRHQYPKMRESEIVVRIIKEWENMDTPKKKNLYERYEASKSIKDDDNRSVFSTAHKTAQKTARLSPTPYSKTHLPKATIYPPLFPYKKDEEMDSDFNRNSDRQSEDLQSNRSSYSIIVREQGEGSFVSNRNYHYIQFYKYNYARLMHEHPRWSAVQISQIIKLEWEKKKKTMKAKSSKKITKQRKRSTKPISGRVFFKNLNKGKLSTKEYVQVWRRLPEESKKRYGLWSKGGNEASRKKPDQLIFKTKHVTPEDILSRQISQRVMEGMDA